MQEILSTTGIVALISAGFAILLTVADKFLNDYGIVNLRINKEKEYQIEGGQTLSLIHI